jgi:hypothetical protein
VVRNLAVEHAKKLAVGERRIDRLNDAIRQDLSVYVQARTDLERRQCEELLRMSDTVKATGPGQHGAWLFALAGALADSSLRLGSHYSVSGLESRLDVARKAARDPGVWAHALALAYDANGVVNFQRLLKKLRPKNLAEHQDDMEKLTEEAPLETPPAATEEPDPGTQETALRVAEEKLAAADAVLDVLDIDEHAADAVPTAKALKEKADLYETVVAENQALRAEVEQLRAELARVKGAAA